jgi:hypothetical protein
MGKATNSQAEAHDISSGSQKDRSGSESTVGEGEARRTRTVNLGPRIQIQTGLKSDFL